MKNKQLVSIIIPNWNGRILLEKNLPHVIKAAKNPKNQIKEIVVVDDASTDDSCAFLETYFPNDVKLIRHSVNRGFSVTVNRGVRAASGKLICLLNTDVIPEDKFLETVLQLFDDKELFAVGLHEARYGPSTGYFKDGYFQHSNKGEMDKVDTTMWVSGGSGVFSAKIWRELHGFDEKLFSPFYWEDVDIGYRALKRGYKLLWDPKAHVVHKHESVISVSNFKKKHLDLIKERNHLLFTWKNVTSKSYTKRHMKALVKRTISHPGYLKVVFMAMLKLGIVKKRRNREISEEAVSDETIFAKFNQ